MATLNKLKDIVSLDRLNRDGVPSASFAILEDGNISADVLTDGKESTETVYQAASISKPITALAVAKLVDEGRLTYETRIVDHLPQEVIDSFIDPETAHLFQNVTVEMILSHTSGLSQGSFPGYNPSKPLPSAQDIIAGRHPSNMPKLRLLYFPGTQWSYSGGGFTVLQLLLESVTGMEFAAFMQETVLDPLGMRRSWFGDLKAGEKNYASAHVTAYTKADADYHVLPEIAAAALWTTPSDLLKAIAAVQNSLHSNGGGGEGGAFLKRATAKRMLTKSPWSSKGEMNMALGWVATESTFSHSGSNVPGFTCFAFGFHGGVVNISDDDKEKDLGGAGRDGFVVMTNARDAWDVCIKQAVAAVYWVKGWPAPEGMESVFMRQADFVPYAVPEGKVEGEGWKEWVGLWDGEWTLSGEGRPMWACKRFEAMVLVPAATAARASKDGKGEHCFVVDGLDVTVTLMWEGEERVVRLLQGGPRTLKRTS